MPQLEPGEFYEPAHDIALQVKTLDGRAVSIRLSISDWTLAISNLGTPVAAWVEGSGNE